MQFVVLTNLWCLFEKQRLLKRITAGEQINSNPLLTNIISDQTLCIYHKMHKHTECFQIIASRNIKEYSEQEEAGVMARGEGVVY